MKLTVPKTLLGACAAVVVGAVGLAQIERLNLEQMVTKAENAVYGTITGKEVHQVPHPVGGGPMFFTTLYIEGKSLYNGQNITVGVSFPGGFVDDTNGVYNSEAPAADDCKTGKKVVVFYKWSDNMGGNFASNALYASHGGLYTTFVNRKGKIVVQGRGDGYAVKSNITLPALETSIGTIREAAEKNK